MSWLLDQAGGRLAGVVDQDVDAAEAGGDLADHLLAVFLGGDIHREHERVAADLADQVRGLGERLGPTRADRDVRALAGQRHGGRASDALAPTGDDRDFAIESQVHDGLLHCRQHNRGASPSSSRAAVL